MSYIVGTGQFPLKWGEGYLWVEIHNPGGSVTYLNPWDNGIGGLDSIQITVGPGSKAYFIVSDTGTLSSASYSFWVN